MDNDHQARISRRAAMLTWLTRTAHTGRDTTNATDGIFREGGQLSMLALSQAGRGYTGTHTLGAQA